MFCCCAKTSPERGSLSLEENVVEKQFLTQPLTPTFAMSASSATLSKEVDPTETTEATETAEHKEIDAKKQSKVELQKLVKTFAKNAVNGVPIALVDADGFLYEQTLFLDKELKVITLLRSGEEPIQLELLQVTDIIKSAYLVQYLDTISKSILSQCVGIEYRNALLLLCERCPTKRHDLYLCLKILKASAHLKKKDKNQK